MSHLKAILTFGIFTLQELQYQLMYPRLNGQLSILDDMQGGVLAQCAASNYISQGHKVTVFIKNSIEKGLLFLEDVKHFILQ